jgi:hypothetical protein
MRASPGKANKLLGKNKDKQLLFATPAVKVNYQGSFLFLAEVGS